MSRIGLKSRMFSKLHRISSNKLEISIQISEKHRKQIIRNTAQ